MYCTECGKNVPEDAVFCVVCGHKISTEQISSDDVKISREGREASRVEEEERIKGESITPYNPNAKDNSALQGSMFRSILVGVIIAIFLLAISGRKNQDQVDIVVETSAENKYASSDNLSPIEKLAEAQPSDISAYGELADMFHFGSDYTDLQRENKFNEIEGKVVAWQLPVYDVERSGSGYRIQTNTSTEKGIFGALSGQMIVGTVIELSPRDESDRRLVESLKTGDIVSFKGVIKGTSMRYLEIEPAILVDTTPPLPAEVATPAAVSDEVAPPGKDELGSSTQAFATPSFDCSKTKSAAEMLICSDAELAGLDNELAAVYEKAKAVSNDANAFKEINDQEWTRREKDCHDRDCLLAWYSNRRSQLMDIIHSNSALQNAQQAN